MSQNVNNKVSTYCIRFRLAIPADKYLSYFQGKAQYVMARSEDNRTIKFPASAIRTFLTHDGVFGLFEIHFDENNKFVKLERI